MSFKLIGHSLGLVFLTLIPPGVHPLVSSFINPCGFALSIAPTFVPLRRMMSSNPQPFLQLPFVYLVPGCHMLMFSLETLADYLLKSL